MEHKSNSCHLFKCRYNIYLRMYQHVMFFQGSTLSKGFSTYLTFLTFLFLMYVIDMRFQVKIWLTPMITIVTFVRSFFFMHTFDSRLKLYFTLNVLPHWWHSKRLILSVWWKTLELAQSGIGFVMGWNLAKS